MARIAVTGAGGFIGRSLTQALVGAGHKVTAIDLSGCPNNRVDVEWIQCDLRNSAFAKSALRDVDVCVALAGRSGGVGFFSQHPASILRDNILITAETLESCIKNGVRRIIFTSSSCVFSQSIKPPFKEDEVEAHQQPLPVGYAFSKLAGEKLCQAYREQYGLEFTVVRPFNVYGPGELPGENIGDGHVIPELTGRILKRENPLRILGNGRQTRSFLFIDDMVAALLAMIDNPRAANMDFNIGTSDEITIIELAQQIWHCAKLVGQPNFQHIQAFSGDVLHRGADSSRARALLGWTPKISLNQGLPRYVDWYKATVDGHGP